MQAVLWNGTIGMSPLGHDVPDGLAVVPLIDMAPSRVVIVWNEGDTNPLTRSLVHIATAAYREPWTAPDFPASVSSIDRTVPGSRGARRTLSLGCRRPTRSIRKPVGVTDGTPERSAEEVVQIGRTAGNPAVADRLRLDRLRLDRLELDRLGFDWCLSLCGSDGHQHRTGQQRTRDEGAIDSNHFKPIF
jgi:hypothetical protein